MNRNNIKKGQISIPDKYNERLPKLEKCASLMDINTNSKAFDVLLDMFIGLERIKITFMDKIPHEDIKTIIPTKLYEKWKREI